MSDSNHRSTVAIPSTGQTFDDLAGLIRLLKIYTQEHNETSDGFVPPSLVNPRYVPVTNTTVALIVSGLSIVALTLFLVCQIAMRFASQTGHHSKNNPLRQRGLLLEDYAILVGYVCSILSNQK